MRYLTFILIALFFISGCKSRQQEPEATGSIVAEPRLKKDMEEIKEDGVLKAIVVYGGTSYFLYRGQPMGYEYELLERFADHLDLELEVVIAHDMNEIISLLNKGEGDLIGHGMTITQERRDYVDFSDYVYLTQQVLVQRKPDNWRQMKRHEIQRELISSPVELIGDTVSVRKNSSYYHRLQNLQEEIGGKIHIDTISGDVPTDEIIKKVVDGETEYTIADKNIAEINSSYYPVLDVGTEISFSQRIAWAVRENSPDLLQELNEWIKQMRKQTDYYVIYNKYFKNQRSFRARVESDFYSKNSGMISQYDDIVKNYTSKIGWDWRFVSSVIYQESQFNPNSQSWAGARGLMQIMPPTARELGIKDVTDPEDNIRGGTRYLKQMWNRWEEIPDSVERMKFTLASYNCGYGHVKDAQRLAEEHGEEPMEWENSVKKYLLKLSYPEYYNDEVVRYGYVRGIEPVTYVRQIMKRYDHYRDLIPS